MELAKPALNGDDAAAADSTRHTLLYVLEALLRLLHPLIPFVTEELWQQVAPRLGIAGGTISLQSYPQAADFAGNDYAQAETDVEWLKDMVSALRRVRSELGVSPAKQVRLLLQEGNANDRKLRAIATPRSLRSCSSWKRSKASQAIRRRPRRRHRRRVEAVGAAGRPRRPRRRTRAPGQGDQARRGENWRSRKPSWPANLRAERAAAVVDQERQRLVDWTTQLDGLSEQRAKL